MREERLLAGRLTLLPAAEAANETTSPQRTSAPASAAPYPNGAAARSRIEEMVLIEERRPARPAVAHARQLRDSARSERHRSLLLQAASRRLRAAASQRLEQFEQHQTHAARLLPPNSTSLSEHGAQQPGR